ncbi:hypothetical protein [Sphingomonas oryzagri]
MPPLSPPMPLDIPAARRSWVRHVRGREPLLVAIAAPLLLAIGFILFAPPPFTTDVAWQFWVAHRLREGAVFYRDIMETNPPLWFWMAMPVDAAAGFAGIRPETMLVLALGAASAASLAATERLTGNLPASHRIALLILAALLMLAMPFGDTGQREQYAMISALPYAALAAARRCGRPVDARLALAVGIGGGLGFALKHYFVGAPLLIELWLLARRRRSWRSLLRPEVTGLALVASLYVAALLLLTPDYLTRVVPDLRLAYGAAASRPLWQMIQLPQYLWGLALLVLFPSLALMRRGSAPLTTALLLAATGFAIAWWIQHKGWPYHAIAATGCLAMALAALLAEVWQKLPVAARMVAPAAIILPLAQPLMPAPPPPPALGVDSVLAGLRRGDAVGFVSTEIAIAWPHVWNDGFRYPGRYNAYWMLWAMSPSGLRDPAVAAFGRRIVAETVQDYRCLPPRRIVFQRPVSGGDAAGDPLAFFRRDPAFAQLLGHYRLTVRSSAFEGWDRRTPLPAGLNCRRGT